MALTLSAEVGGQLKNNMAEHVSHHPEPALSASDHQPIRVTMDRDYVQDLYVFRFPCKGGRWGSQLSVVFPTLQISGRYYMANVLNASYCRQPCGSSSRLRLITLNHGHITGGIPLFPEFSLVQFIVQLHGSFAACITGSRPEG